MSQHSALSRIMGLLPVLPWIWLLTLSCAWAADNPLRLYVEPPNDDLIRNIESHLGEINGRDVAALRRFQRGAAARVREAAAALGYYQIKVDWQLQPGESPRLVLNVMAGPQVHLRDVRLRLQGEGAALAAFTLPTSQPYRRLKTGEPLNHGVYEAVKRFWQDQALRLGFFDARFVQSELLVDVQQGLADAQLTFDTGPRYQLGAVVFSGEHGFDPEFLKRYVRFAPATPYSADLLLNLNQDLMASGYFDQANVDARPQDAQDRILPVKVSLVPQERRSWGVGAGFSTDVGPRLRNTWDERWINPQGHRRGAALEVSAVRQSLGAYYEIPLDPPASDSLRFSGGYQNESIEDTRSRLLTAGVQWQHLLANQWRRTISITGEAERFELGEVSARTRQWLYGVGFGRTKADSAIDPSEGYRVQLDIASAHQALFSDTNLLRAELLVKGIFTLAQRHRFLGRLQAGAVATSDFDRIAPSLRFFAGGDQSVRGYDYQSLSPKDINNEGVGGRYLLTATAEYQYQFLPRWRLATFIDQGNAVDAISDGMVTGVGLGVRWISPLGPLRLDLAKGLDADAGGDFQVHFSMGPDL